MAWKLHHEFLARGYKATLVVGRKYSNDPRVTPIPMNSRYRGLGSLKVIVKSLWGYQYEHFPDSHLIPELVGSEWDIIQVHNLHGGYFDVAALTRLQAIAPVILTLHDMWLLTGHCAHPIGSDGWRNGCGSCCSLSLYPAIRRDATRHNLARKMTFLGQGRFWVAPVAAWLDRIVAGSYLSRHPRRLMYNPVDSRSFFVGDRVEARARLGLDPKVHTILFPATLDAGDPYKGRETFLAAIDSLPNPKPMVLAFEGREEPPPGIQVLPRTYDEAAIASYYRAADLTVLSSIAETSPLTILESIACGVPVIATNVGGIPELIQEGLTGWIVQPGSAVALADAISQTLASPMKLQTAQQARAALMARHDLARVVDEWTKFYLEILGEPTNSAGPN